MKNTYITLLTDTDTDSGNRAEFDALFNEDIVIKPGSEIALESVSLNKTLDLIQINSFNNEIKFQVQAATQTVDTVIHGGEYTIVLNKGTYIKTNLITLLNEIQVKMNQQLGLNSAKEIGSQVVVGLDKKELLSFEIFQVPNNSFLENGSSNNVSNGITFQSAYLKTNTANAVIHQNYKFCKTEFVKGCGLFKARLRKFTNADNTTPAGACIGLILNTPANIDKLNDGTIALDDIEYGIRTNINFLNTANYETYVPGSNVVVTSNLAPFKTDNNANTANNDVIEIGLNKGKIEMRVHNSNGETHVLYSQDYNYGNVTDGHSGYIGILVIFGDNTTTRIDDCTLSIDPYEARAATYDSHLGDSLVGVAPKTQSTVPTIYKLRFQTLEIANYFGFENVAQNIDNVKTQTGLFTGENLMSSNIGTNTYLVELLNIPLNSYHSLEKGRKSILCSIPISEKIINNSGQIQYQPPTMFFISLNNKFDLNLRNIRARIINNDFSPVSTEGISEISIIIREHMC